MPTPVLDQVSFEVLARTTDSGFVVGYTRIGGRTLDPGAAPTWVPYLANANSLTFSRGGSRLGPTSRVEPGILSLRLVNAGDPANDFRIRPNADVRVRTTSGIVLFTGVIQDVDVDFDKDGNRFVTVVAVDGVQALANTTRYGSVPEAYETTWGWTNRTENWYQRIHRLSSESPVRVSDPVGPEILAGNANPAASDGFGLWYTHQATATAHGMSTSWNATTKRRHVAHDYTGTVPRTYGVGELGVRYGEDVGVGNEEYISPGYIEVQPDAWTIVDATLYGTTVPVPSRRVQVGIQFREFVRITPTPGSTTTGEFVWSPVTWGPSVDVTSTTTPTTLHWEFRHRPYSGRQEAARVVLANADPVSVTGPAAVLNFDLVGLTVHSAEHDVYRLEPNEWEASLADHYTLACDSVGAYWYVDRENVAQFRRNFALEPGADVVLTDKRNPLTTPPALVSERTNHAYDPEARTTTYWTSSRWFGSGAGAGTYSFVTGSHVTDGPLPQVQSYRRKTWNSVPTTNNDTGFQVNGPTAQGLYPCAPGDAISLSGYLRSSVGNKTGVMRIQWRTSANIGIVSTPHTPAVKLQAGQWHRLENTLVAPDNAFGFVILLDVVQTGGDTLWQVGDTLDGTAIQVEVGKGTGEFRRNLVPNPTFASSVAGWAWSGTSGLTATTNTATPYSGSSHARLTWPTATTHSNMTFLTGMLPVEGGKPYTLQLAVRPNGTQTLQLVVYYYAADNSYITGLLRGAITVAANTWTSVNVLTNAPANAAYARVGPYVAAANVVSGRILDVDAVLFEQTSTLRGYFDGTQWGCTWEGTAHNSPSRREVLSTVPVTPYFSAYMTSTPTTFYSWVGVTNGPSNVKVYSHAADAWEARTQVAYTDIRTTQGSRDVVNELKVSNFEHVPDPTDYTLPGTYVTHNRIERNISSVATWGPRSQSLNLNLSEAELLTYEGPDPSARERLSALAAELLAVTADATRRVRSVSFDGRAYATLPDVSTLEVYRRVEVHHEGTVHVLRIIQIRHELQPDGWMVHLDLMPDPLTETVAP